MTVSTATDRIRLHGPLTVEDAETLVAAAMAAPALPIDWSEAGPLHTAVLQALLMLRPTLVGDPADAFDRTFLAPILRRTSASSEGQPAAPSAKESETKDGRDDPGGRR